MKFDRDQKYSIDERLMTGQMLSDQTFILLSELLYDVQYL